MNSAANNIFLYISINRTHAKFVRKNKMLALGVCFPQPARALAAGLPNQDHVWITTDRFIRFYKDQFDEILVNWIQANTHVRFNKTQPCFKIQSQKKKVQKERKQSEWNSPSRLNGVARKSCIFSGYRLWAEFAGPGIRVILTRMK